MNNICRTCLRSAEKLLSVLEDAQLPYKIELISSVQVLANDNLPMNVCAECILYINVSYNFRKLIINSDLELRNHYKSLKRNENESNKPTDILNTKISNQNGYSHEEETFSTDEPNINFDPVSLKSEKSNGVENISHLDGTVKSNTNAKTKNGEASHIPRKIIQAAKTNCVTKLRRSYTYETKIYKCRSCDFTHSEYSKFKKHKRLHWATKPVLKTVCNICGKSIRSDNLKKHISIHTEQPVACEQCGKICKNTESLRGHALIHKGIVLKCKICGKVYKYRAGYALHLKRHALGDVRTVKCSLCDKSFFGKTDLKKHIRSHTGERPYPCEFCKKGFSSSYALKTHRRQHTNERPYACALCSMAFPQKVSLRTHLKSKHGTATLDT